MSDYDMIESWLRNEIDRFTTGIERLCAERALYATFVVEFAESAPETANYYADMVPSWQSRIDSLAFHVESLRSQLHSVTRHPDQQPVANG